MRINTNSFYQPIKPHFTNQDIQTLIDGLKRREDGSFDLSGTISSIVETAHDTVAVPLSEAVDYLFPEQKQQLSDEDHGARLVKAAGLDRVESSEEDQGSKDEDYDDGIEEDYVLESYKEDSAIQNEKAKSTDHPVRQQMLAELEMVDRIYSDDPEYSEAEKAANKFAKGVDKGYVYTKAAMKALVAVGAEIFAENFPKTAKELSNLSDDVKKGIDVAIDKADNKLGEIFWQEYKDFKAGVSSISYSEHTPIIVKDLTILIAEAAVGSGLLKAISSVKNFKKVSTVVDDVKVDSNFKSIEYDVNIKKFTPEIQKGLTNALQVGNKDVATSILKEKLGWQGFDKSILDKIPDDLISKGKIADGFNNPTNPTVGVKFYDKNGNGIRIMKGNPNAKHASQQVDYVKITSNGKVLLKDGRAITDRDFPKPREHPDSHIPLSEYKNWKNGFEK